MSLQKGNATRTRAQKHQNMTAFKNDKYDHSQKTKAINSLDVCNLCQRCKEVIEWKIKYKKYKPLTVPKKCVQCGGKTVKAAYHVICDPCAVRLQTCAKCQKKEEGVAEKKKDLRKEQVEFERELKALPERKRRTVMRYIEEMQTKKRNKRKEEEKTEKKEKESSKECVDDTELDEELLAWAKNTMKELKIDDDDDDDDDSEWEDEEEIG